MIINSLIHIDKIEKPVSKEVSFTTIEGIARSRYSQAYAVGLSSVKEEVSLRMSDLTELEVVELEALFEQQDTDKFIGYVLPNDTVERPFYPPKEWEKQEVKTHRGTVTELKYTISFKLVNYYG